MPKSNNTYISDNNRFKIPVHVRLHNKTETLKSHRQCNVYTNILIVITAQNSENFDGEQLLQGPHYEMNPILAKKCCYVEQQPERGGIFH